MEISTEVFETLKQWKQEASSNGQSLSLRIGVDIGGTNTRIALARHTIKKSEPFLLGTKFAANTLKDLLTSLESFGDRTKEVVGFDVISACLAVAGPVSDQGSTVNITNFVGETKLTKTDLPKNLFPSGRTVFLNDLASLAEGILALNHSGTLSEFFHPLWGFSNTNIVLSPVNYLILAMGTGLGCGLLVSDGQSHTVLPLETGHTLITSLGPDHPDAAEEKDLFQFLSRKIYKGKFSLEFEDICSGRGLGFCYEFLTLGSEESEPKLTTAQIVSKAKSNDLKALRAVYLHYKYLIRSAQTQCVGLLGKGVFLAGDNQVSNDPIVTKYIEEFQREFRNHPKSHWLEDVPVFRQTKSFNLNLLGCLYSAEKYETKGTEM